MKLEEIIKDLFKSELRVTTANLLSSGFTIFDDNTLFANELEGIVEFIEQCDEFKECSEINFITSPHLESDKLGILDLRTYKLNDKMKFSGKAFISSISLTPTMYDGNKMHDSVKDGACITPVDYSPVDFVPRRKIILEFSPEVLQDKSANNVELELFDRLHATLDNVLKNPDEYMIKGTRHVMVRGIFENVIVEDVLESIDFGEIKTDDDLEYVFYPILEMNKVEGEVMSVEMHKFYIPKRFGDKFVEKFGGQNPSRFELNQYLIGLFHEEEKELTDNK